MAQRRRGMWPLEQGAPLWRGYKGASDRSEADFEGRKSTFRSLALPIMVNELIASATKQISMAARQSISGEHPGAVMPAVKGGKRAVVRPHEIPDDGAVDLAIGKYLHTACNLKLGRHPQSRVKASLQRVLSAGILPATVRLLWCATSVHEAGKPSKKRRSSPASIPTMWRCSG